MAINFPLRTAFTVSHRFWVNVFSLSLVSMNFFFINLFIYLFGCLGSSLLCTGFSLVVASVVVLCGLLIVVASLVAEHGL